MEKSLQQVATDCLKVAFVGPECTGKTTLCTELASYYHTSWVEEYMRTYLQRKWNTSRETCVYDDLLPIALGQMQCENEQARKANRLLFCDTNLFELIVYSEIYYGKCPESILKAYETHKYNLVFLTNVDIPWEKDDLRDRPNDREPIFHIFRDFLVKYKQPFIVLSGEKEVRLKLVKASVESLLHRSSV